MSLPQAVYLDYNATAPLLPEALEAMSAAARDLPGNPSSPHSFGQAARAALEAHRRRLAASLGFERHEVIFNSGGSEGNNTVLRWLAELDEPAHLITTPIEHPSVLRTAEWLERRGVAVSYLPVDATGRAQPDAVADLMRPETRLVSVMAANNETGVLQPLAEIARAVREATSEPERVVIHSDAVQAFGRVPLDPAGWGVDAVTVAAHKLGGPKGIGALACRDAHAMPPLILGGAQERGQRAGTESPMLVAGFLAAVAWLEREREALAARLTALRERLESGLGEIEGAFVNGAGAPRLPNTTNVGFEGVAARSLLAAMDLNGVAISSGSACSSGAVEPSHVLTAMGLPAERIAASVRISLGWATTEAEIDRCVELMTREVSRIRHSGARASA